VLQALALVCVFVWPLLRRFCHSRQTAACGLARGRGDSSSTGGGEPPAAAAEGVGVLPTPPSRHDSLPAHSELVVDSSASNRRAPEQQWRRPAPHPPPPHWPADKNDWWEGGLQLAKRRGDNERIDVLVAVLSGRAAKYAARREIIREEWATDLMAMSRRRGFLLRVVFVVSDNYCGYEATKLPASVRSFPSEHCRTADEHMVGGRVSDEHTELLAEYRRHHDLVFVPETLDSYYNSAAKMNRFWKILDEAQIDFGLVLKMDDDGVLMRKYFLEHYVELRPLLDPGNASLGPRWWGHFMEGWEPVRAADDHHFLIYISRKQTLMSLCHICLSLFFVRR
jgi:hypothetical protein